MKIQNISSKAQSLYGEITLAFALDSSATGQLDKFTLKLAKVPDTIIEAVRQLMSAWATKVFLNTDKEIEIDEIKYLNEILQGDLLSLILFILSVNPLSFLLEKCDGYTIRPSTNKH